MASEASRELFKQQIEEISDEFGIPKYAAFPRWICQNILGIELEDEVDEAVSIGGKGDYGIDIFHTNENGDSTEQYVCWIQAKFSETLNRVVIRDEMETFLSTLGHMESCPTDANRTFKQKSAELLAIQKDNPQIQKRLIFAVTGGINEQVERLIAEDAWKKDLPGREAYQNVHLEIWDLDSILSRMVVPHTPTVKIKFDGIVIERSGDVAGRKSIIGYVSASSLVDLSKTHRETLFLENPRQAIGSTAPTHKAILNTLNNADKRKMFWKMNNGVTAICTSLDADSESAYSIKNLKIVNGRQTAYTLEEAAHKLDDVYLLMAIHEAVNEDERNSISEATNTQNPIKPVDLVTNYPEMTELVIQCRKDFTEFYFERQTNGFKSTKKSTQNRVTSRRVMKKGPSARAYYAYAINPADAIMPDNMLFSTISEPNYYDAVFNSRKIEELIIPHIFMQSLAELHRTWCRDLKDDPSDETARNKGIISKGVIKYFILRFIHYSMISIDESTQNDIKAKMIKEFRTLKKDDELPPKFLEVAHTAYVTFMRAFDSEKKMTWPSALLEKMPRNGKKGQTQDRPSPRDIMDILSSDGHNLLGHLIDARNDLIVLTGDVVKEKLLSL